MYEPNTVRPPLFDIYQRSVVGIKHGPEIAPNRSSLPDSICELPAPKVMAELTGVVIASGDITGETDVSHEVALHLTGLEPVE